MNKTSSRDDLLGDHRIAFVEAGWHQDIVEQARLAFCETIAESGIDRGAVDTIKVPGSLEIPLHCQMLAESGHYRMIVAAGFIIDGGIYRHDFVASSVIDGIVHVQLKTGIPILSVVLTPHHFSGSEEHYQFFYDHFKVKGREAGEACIAVLGNLSLHRYQNWHGSVDDVMTSVAQN